MKDKKLIVFDMDGTLTESKSEVDDEMSNLVLKLLDKKLMAIISGSHFYQIEKQFLKKINKTYSLKNLFIFPACSTSFYKYDKEWQKIYSQELTQEEKNKILSSFESALKDINYFQPQQTYGKIFEDRETQITFSALGQQAPLELKKQWDHDGLKRIKIKKRLETYITEFEIRLGGTTSIDVTRKGIDKAYGIQQIEKYLQINKKDMLFIGDALFEGGNDYPIKKTGVDCIEVYGPEDTKTIIKHLIY